MIGYIMMHLLEGSYGREIGAFIVGSRNLNED